MSILLSGDSVLLHWEMESVSASSSAEERAMKWKVKKAARGDDDKDVMEATGKCNLKSL